MVAAKPAQLLPVEEKKARRKGEVVTVAFTEKGRELLKPRALISFKADTRWQGLLDASAPNRWYVVNDLKD